MSISSKVVGPRLGEQTGIAVQRSLSATTSSVTPGSFGGSFRDVLQQMSESWGQMQARELQLSHRLPSELRGLFELQRLGQRVQLQTELISRTAEAVGGTMRKLQQLGSS